MTAPPIPSDAAGLLDTLSDPAKVKAIADEGPAGWAKFHGNFKDAFEARDKGASQEQIEIQVQRAMMKMFREQGGDGEIKRVNLDSPEYREATNRYASTRKATAYNKHAPGAMLDNEFDGPGDFFKSCWHLNDDSKTLAKMAGLREKVRNAYSSTVPADGGFLVPERLRSELLRVALESAIVRPRARVIPMDSLRVPFPVLDSTTNVGSVHGGMIAYWTEESAALIASQAKFARIVLEAKKLTGMSIIPNELLQDSIISMAAFIEENWPEALAWFEDLAFLRGTGTGEPLGVLGAGNPASIAVSKESGQLADTIVWENIIKMWSRMLPNSAASAVWLYSPNAFPELATMALSVGTGGSAVWLNNGVQGPPMTILGRPAIMTEKASTVGDRGDLALIDFRNYLVGDRQTMTTASSTDYRFGNDETAYRIIQRVDGRPGLLSAVTPQNGGDTLSAFVELEARA